MTLASVLTFEQYSAQLATLKAKQVEIKARILALDTDMDKGFELMLEFAYAGMIYAVQGKAAYMHYCNLQVQTITDLFLTATSTMLSYRQEVNAITEEVAQLTRRWNSRMMR